MIYLDHQSTTPVLPEVFEAMQPFFAAQFGNPSSLHSHGLRARDAIGTAREQVAHLINAESPEEIIFTSGGTEATNTAVKGIAYAHQRQGKHIVVSAIEHPAVLNSVELLVRQGFTVTKVRVDREGRIAPSDVEAALQKDTILICMHHANHDIGTIEPIGEIGRVATERGIPFFVDAVASGGWAAIDVQALGISLLSLAPHRFYGPKGVGVLYRNRRTRLESLIHGGIQEEGRRAGTENVAGIVGAGVAAELAQRNLDSRVSHVATLQRLLWDGLRARIPHTYLNGPEPGPNRLATNLNVSFESIEGEGVTLMADMQGLALASGASCVSKSLKASAVLSAIGVSNPLALGNIILSPGIHNTEAEMTTAVEVLERVVKKLRGMSPAWEEFTRESTKG